MPTELLTDNERILLKHLGEVWRLFNDVLRENGSYPHDDQEIIYHIHVLQRYVLSDAAARAYPDEYRAIGASLHEDL